MSGAAVGAGISVRRATGADWRALKQLRLAALLDAPTAFGVRHADALAERDEAWQVRAAGSGRATYFLAFSNDGAGDGGKASAAIGMAAAVRIDAHTMALIAMWVSPPWRGQAGAAGQGAAALLVEAVKAHAGATGAGVHADVGDGCNDGSNDGSNDSNSEDIGDGARAGAPAAITELRLEVAPANARAVALYQRHGFRLQPHVEPLASHPHIMLQRMVWQLAAGQPALSSPRPSR